MLFSLVRRRNETGSWRHSLAPALLLEASATPVRPTSAPPPGSPCEGDHHRTPTWKRDLCGGKARARFSTGKPNPSLAAHGILTFTLLDGYDGFRTPSFKSEGKCPGVSTKNTSSTATLVFGKNKLSKWFSNCSCAVGVSTKNRKQYFSV